jgi:uncharacterized protein involved in exopolysaccharide biosynthesis
MSVSISSPQSPELSLGSVVALLWRRKWIIVLSGMIFAAIFGGIAFATKPVFRSVLRMNPADTDRMGSFGAALGSVANLATAIGIDIGEGGSIHTQEALAVLRSREFRESFIRDLNLMPVLFGSRWDASGRRWKTGLQRTPTMEDALERLNEVLVIGRDPKTTLYFVQAEWTDARTAASWPNTLVDRLNSEMRARSLRRTDAYIHFLEQELGTATSVDARKAISQVLGAQLNERMLATVTEEYAFKVIERAAVPDRKYRPRRSLQVMIGGIAGGFIGVVLVLFAPAFRRNFEDALRVYRAP